MMEQFQDALDTLPPDHLLSATELLFHGHQAAAEHIDRCYDELHHYEEADEPYEWDDDWSPMAPFCGCDTCTVRETLAGAIDYLWGVFRLIEDHGIKG